MTRRLITNIALAVAGAFALVVATPAFACDCDKKARRAPRSRDKKADKAAPAPKQAPAQEKKAEASKATTLLLAAADCKCGAKDPKDCKCEKGCKCQDEARHDDRQAQGQRRHLVADLLVAAACACGAKEAKDCKCGEKCKCHREEGRADGAEGQGRLALRCLQRTRPRPAIAGRGLRLSGARRGRRHQAPIRSAPRRRARWRASISPR